MLIALPVSGQCDRFFLMNQISINSAAHALVITEMITVQLEKSPQAVKFANCYY